MEQTKKQTYAIDNASLLFLSLIQKNHTNTFRFSMTLAEDICPATLQMAVNRIYRRFPTVIAGFYPGLFHYFQVPAKSAPEVQPDPGVLHTMTKEEIRNCAYRVLYHEKNVSIEAFHALTDGYGAIASFTTLVAEYLRLKYGVHIPVEKTLIDPDELPAPHEVTDSFADYESGEPLLVPSRFSYQLPGDAPSAQGVRVFRETIPTKVLLDASHRYGVSMTTLLSTVMAEAIMEIQKNHIGKKQAQPVRIMVPIDLRRKFPSRTLRNFSLYSLPTMEPADVRKTFQERLHSFAEQMAIQFERSRLESVMAYNVRSQNAWFFRFLPWIVKQTCLRIGYRFFGGSNSSLTVTNLGNVQLPEQMQKFVEDFEVMLTPRVSSPYGCAIISNNGRVAINISQFGQKMQLKETFFRKLYAVL